MYDVVHCHTFPFITMSSSIIDTIHNNHYSPGIYSYGFEKPSAIQQRGIKPLLMGRDTIGQAQSGEYLLLVIEHLWIAGLHP